MKAKKNEPAGMTLPGIPKSLGAWIADWIEMHYPDRKMKHDRAQMRAEMWNDLPGVYWPDLPALVATTWWTSKFAQHTKTHGFVFLDGDNGKGVVAYQDELPWDDMQSLLVGKLRRASDDVYAVERDLTEYSDLHPELHINVATTMRELRRAAGI